MEDVNIHVHHWPMQDFIMLVIVCLTLAGKIVPPGGESFRCIVQYESMDYRFTNYFKSLYLNPVVIIAI